VSKVRVMHYINQFFAGIGGEDKANVPAASIEGAVGPGKPLQTVLGDSAEIVVTAYCGDDYFSTNSEEALAAIVKIAKDRKVELLMAGPAFSSGRHGIACVEVCHAVSTSLGINCVTGMHIENPAVESYKGHKNRKVFCIPTAKGVVGMRDALSKMGKFALKLAAGSAIEPAADEGYIPRGIRVVEAVGKSSAARVVDMVLDKLAGRSFTSEIPIVLFEAISIPAAIKNLKGACIALVSTGGIVPPGNPDGLKSMHNTNWAKYDIAKMESMKDAEWDVVHGGYDNQFMLKNPNFGVPLDVARQLEKEGVFGRLYPYFYSASGCIATVTAFQAIGRAIAKDLKAEGVDAVLLVST